MITISADAVNMAIYWITGVFVLVLSGLIFFGNIRDKWCILPGIPFFFTLYLIVNYFTGWINLG